MWTTRVLVCHRAWWKRPLQRERDLRKPILTRRVWSWSWDPTGAYLEIPPQKRCEMSSRWFSKDKFVQKSKYIEVEDYVSRFTFHSCVRPRDATESHSAHNSSLYRDQKLNERPRFGQRGPHFLDIGAAASFSASLESLKKKPRSTHVGAQKITLPFASQEMVWNENCSINIVRVHLSSRYRTTGNTLIPTITSSTRTTWASPVIFFAR